MNTTLVYFILTLQLGIPHAGLEPACVPLAVCAGFLYTPPARGSNLLMKKMIANASQRELFHHQFAQFYVVSRTKRSYATKAMIASFHQKSNLRQR